MLGYWTARRACVTAAWPELTIGGSAFGGCGNSGGGGGGACREEQFGLKETKVQRGVSETLPLR